MKLDEFFALHKIFTFAEVAQFISKGERAYENSTLHNLLAYHQKHEHILHVRRGLYYSIPRGITSDNCPIDPFLIASKMAEDAVLGYRTALDFFGKLHSVQDEFIYIAKRRETVPFIFKNVKYRGVSIPSILKKTNNELFGVDTVDRLGKKILVTSLERTLVDVLDRPYLCGSWEEIWLSLENIEYLDLNKVLQYALILNNATTIAKLGFFLESHRESLMVPEYCFVELRKHCPIKPHYLKRDQKQPQKLIANWNLIVPLSIINRQWEEPNENI